MPVTVNKSNELGIPRVKYIELIRRNSWMLVSIRKQGVGVIVKRVKIVIFTEVQASNYFA